jgi:hypothetical protein
LTEVELARIEAALGVVLPVVYRKLVVPFPVPAYVGNAETELWDDADRLVELNRELRDGVVFVHPWPVHMFSMGRDGSGCASAIDLRNPGCPVWWADRCHLDAVGSGQVAQSLEEWAGQYLADLRADLEADCIDPYGSPEARERSAEKNAGMGCRLVIVLLVVGVLMVLALWGLVKWLSL